MNSNEIQEETLSSGHLQKQLLEYRKRQEEKYKKTVEKEEPPQSHQKSQESNPKISSFHEQNPPEETKVPQQASKNINQAPQPISHPLQNKPMKNIVDQEAANIDEDDDFLLAQKLQEEEYQQFGYEQFAGISNDPNQQYNPYFEEESKYENNPNKYAINSSRYNSQPGSLFQNYSPSQIQKEEPVEIHFPPLKAPKYKVYDFTQGSSNLENYKHKRGYNYMFEENDEFEISQDELSKIYDTMKTNRQKAAQKKVSQQRQQQNTNRLRRPIEEEGVRPADEYVNEQLINDAPMDSFAQDLMLNYGYQNANNEENRVPLLENERDQANDQNEEENQSQPRNRNRVNFLCFENVNPRILGLVLLIITLVAVILLLFLINP